jgi:putative sterol carrier protein
MTGQIDPSAVSPEQFAQLIAGASDEDIERTIRQVGVDETLERVFEGFEERFRPEKAEGVQADVQWKITDEGKEYPYLLSIADGKCEARQGETDSAKTTLEADLASFLKLITGKADGVKLFMTRKLKIAGDLMFAQRLMSFFDRPQA